MIRKEQMTIVQHDQIADRIFCIKVRGRMAQHIAEPGQFVYIKIQDASFPLLRRPLSICDVNEDTSELTMIYRVEGIGTTLLATKRCEDTLDILGPLGKGFPIQEVKGGEHALLVGGGIGVPPLYDLAKKLTEKGVTITTIMGFQSASSSFLCEQFQQLGDTYVTTVDGTLGMKGLVTDAIRHHNPRADVTYSCGPKAMLRALTEQLPNDRLYVSLEERMGCGVGACLACVCNVPNDAIAYKKVCSDGPVFLAGEVVL